MVIWAPSDGCGVIVDSVASRDVLAAKPTTTMLQAAKIMHQQGVGSLVAIEDGRPVGIITHTDMVQLIAQQIDPTTTPISDFMSSPVLTVEPTLQLEDAAEIMQEKHVRHLVLMVGDQLRGIVTVKDLAYAMPEAGKRFLDALRARWEDEPR